jgi:hypothetical protein
VFSGVQYQILVIIGTIMMIIAVLKYTIPMHNQLINQTPVVEVSKYFVDTKSIQLKDGNYFRREYTAIIYFSNNPKNRMDKATAKNVYAEISYFDNKFNCTYAGFEGLWFPLKHEKPLTYKHIKENGSTTLEASGRKQKLIVAHKNKDKNSPVAYDNCEKFYSDDINNHKSSYYLKHCLFNKPYYVLIELFGTGIIKETFVFELQGIPAGLYFEQIKDKELCKKIISMKK